MSERPACVTCKDRPRMKRGSYCRTCASEYERVRRAANADEINSRRRKAYDPAKRFAQRLRTYNITREQYDAMLTAQQGCCAICRREADLHVDHDHRCCPESLRSCGKCVRGLLCNRCNNGIGRFEDDPERLRRAADYVAAAWIAAIDRRATAPVV